MIQIKPIKRKRHRPLIARSKKVQPVEPLGIPIALRGIFTQEKSIQKVRTKPSHAFPVIFYPADITTSPETNTEDPLQNSTIETQSVTRHVKCDFLRSDDEDDTHTPFPTPEYNSDTENCDNLSQNSNKT